MREFDIAEARKLAGPVAGAILILAGLLLIGFTEHTDRLRAMGEDALGGFVLSGAEAKPGPSSDGQLVFVSGPVQIAAPARDGQFNEIGRASCRGRGVTTAGRGRPAPSGAHF